MKLVKQMITTCLCTVMLISMICNVHAADGVTASDKTEGVYTVTGGKDDLPDILGESAIVVDMKTGYTLYEKNIYAKRYPASITKIMTALLTLEQASMEEIVTFSYAAVNSVEAGSSIAYISEKEKLTVEQCLYGLMLISGNDIANGLAEHVGGSMNNFADMMTAKATELGCVGTNFENAHGLHDNNHYTCAYDMAVIAKYAYQNLDAFKTICSTLTYECAPTNIEEKTRLWRNKNRLINPYEEAYYKDCIGGKTGYTVKAGGTLVTYAKINGRELLCIIMKSSNSAAAFADTTTLYEYIRNNVSAEMYNNLDKKYEKEHPPVVEQPSQGEDASQNNDGADVNATVDNTPDDVKKSGDDGMGIWGRILLGALFIAIILGGYYAYICYARYLHKKRRRERRMMQNRRRHM